MATRDAVEVAAPHPAAEELRRLLGVGATVKAVDEDLAAEHLLRPFSGPHLQRHALNADPNMQVVNLVDGVIRLAPSLEQKGRAVDEEPAVRDGAVAVRGDVEEHEEGLRVVAGDTQLVGRQPELLLQSLPHQVRVGAVAHLSGGDEDAPATQVEDLLLHAAGSDDDGVARGRRRPARGRLGGDEPIHDRRRSGEAKPGVHRPLWRGTTAEERAAHAGRVTPGPAVYAPHWVSAVGAAVVLAEAAKTAASEPP